MGLGESVDGCGVASAVLLALAYAFGWAAGARRTNPCIAGRAYRALGDPR